MKSAYEWAEKKINDADPDGQRLGEDEFLQACSELEAMATYEAIKRLEGKHPGIGELILMEIEALTDEEVEDMVEDAITLSEN